MNKNNITGFTGAILAAVTFGLNPLFALKLYDGGLSAQTVLFYRFGIGAILIAGMMLFKKAAFTFSRRNFIHLLIAGTCLMGTSIGLFLSFRFMDAGIASTILFTYPVMVTVIMTVFFKEKISFILITSMVLSLAGILIMCNPSAGVKMDIRGILLALLSAAVYAIYMVLIKESRLKHMQSETITFYAMLFSLPYFLIFGGELNIPFSNLSIILNLLGLALFPAFLSFYFLAILLDNILVFSSFPLEVLLVVFSLF